MTTATATATATGFLSAAQIAAAYGVDADTIGDWRTRGVFAPSGQKVKLAALRVGGRWKYRAAAVQEFLEALNPHGSVAPETPPPGPEPGAAARRLEKRMGEKLRKARERMGAGR